MFTTGQNKYIDSEGSYLVIAESHGVRTGVVGFWVRFLAWVSVWGNIALYAIQKWILLLSVLIGLSISRAYHGVWRAEIAYIQCTRLAVFVSHITFTLSNLPAAL